MDKAVILAAGSGTRMRSRDETAQVTQQQAATAATGVKALIPIGRPFLDYILGALADAGYRHVCLVAGPRHDVLRDYYRGLETHRLKISFACQAEPLGTADAVAAACDFVGDDPFLVINSDNYYPAEVLTGLRGLDGPGLIGFDRSGLLASGLSNISRERISKFAIVDTDAEGYLNRIIEKPDEATYAALPEPVLVSINCWRFSPAIFEACRSIERSQRGEFELPAAVEYAMSKLGVKFRVLVSSAAVLDLSTQADIGPVAVRLADTQIEL